MTTKLYIIDVIGIRVDEINEIEDEETLFLVGKRAGGEIEREKGTVKGLLTGGLVKEMVGKTKMEWVLRRREQRPVGGAVFVREYDQEMT